MHRRFDKWPLLVAIAASFSLAGCGGTTFPLTPDASVPFAKGEVSALVAKDGNGEITVSVEHLGDPGKLQLSATTYVIWVQQKKDDTPVQNMGVIKVDDSYSGDHTFSTTFKEFDLTITAEESADVTKPTGRDILKTTVDLN